MLFLFLALNNVCGSSSRLAEGHGHDEGETKNENDFGKKVVTVTTVVK
jgi:hypothetical protein